MLWYWPISFLIENLIAICLFMALCPIHQRPLTNSMSNEAQIYEPIYCRNVARKKLSNSNQQNQHKKIQISSTFDGKWRWKKFSTFTKQFQLHSILLINYLMAFILQTSNFHDQTSFIKATLEKRINWKIMEGLYRPAI